MEQQVAILRNLAARMGVPPLREVAKLPGIKEAYRVTVHYGAMRAPDSCSTLTIDRTMQPALASVYLGFFNHKVITKRIALQQYEVLRTGLIRLRFDHLTDQPNAPFHDVDLWLVERAANGFNKSVMLAPDNAPGTHAEVVKLVRQHLPEAVRELQG
jgi:hypothetical protein